jgi:outer membrane protein assembly factor BamB
VPPKPGVLYYPNHRRSRQHLLELSMFSLHALRFSFVLFNLCLFPLSARADNWPAWRGPTGQGFCEEKNIPLDWSATKNVKWKIPLSEPGNSTPIIWKDKIFLTQANNGGTKRSLLCLNKADGKQLWQKDVAYDEKERNWNPSWYANASPMTDGERVVVSFGSAGVYCYDFEGKELWKRTDLGKWEHQFGNSASPVIYDDLVIQWCGPNEKEGRNFLLGMDKKTGKSVWEHNEKEGSWATPVITKIDGKDQLVLATGPRLKGFEPKSGKELWSCEGLQSYVYPSALISNGIAVGMSGYGKSSLAVKLGGSGDITKDRLWLHPKPANQRVGSGMIVGEHCYIIDENGIPRCYELQTGKNLWEDVDKLKSLTWGSLVHAEGRFYIMLRNGDTVVFAAKPKFEILSINSLERGTQTNSSPALSDGEIFLRTFKNLYCISAKK